METIVAIQVQVIAYQLTVPLRQKLLRPDLLSDEMFYSGDDAESTVHYGAYEGKRLVGIVTFYERSHPELSFEPNQSVFQLRGMAVEADYQGQGIGRQLVEAFRRDYPDAGIWCHARQLAEPFYHRLGFQAVGDRYDILPIGLHRLMRFQPRSAT